MVPPAYTLLVQRSADEPIAVIGDKTIRLEAFLQHTNWLTQQLPDQPYAINLCRDRYHFLVSFCAVVARGQCNLLPANRFSGTQWELVRHYPACYAIHDGAEITEGLREFDCSNMFDSPVISRNADYTKIPEIPVDQSSAISFTSGSTGQSSANLKTWRILQNSSVVNAHHMLAGNTSTQYLLATVPAQHMYGLETSILLPMFANVCISNEQPLFPRDVSEALACLPEPRVLVSTPVHLRAMVESGIEFPSTELIFSATAPLEKSLATRVETLFSGRLREIYGCSEVGSIAWRHTSNDKYWRLFNGFTCQEVDGKTMINAAYLPEAVTLQDQLRFTKNDCFELCGRQTDMINIAGKRGSLVQLNQLLLAMPGVKDGVVFQPGSGAKVERLAALVVGPGLTSRNIASYFRQYVDPVFLPRPILFVNSLPRSETGKLPRQQVLMLYDRTRKFDQGT